MYRSGGGIFVYEVNWQKSCSNKTGQREGLMLLIHPCDGSKGLEHKRDNLNTSLEYEVDHAHTRVGIGCICDGANVKQSKEMWDLITSASLCDRCRLIKSWDGKTVHQPSQCFKY